MGKSNVRKPVVAGQFYPSNRQQLEHQLGSFINKKADKINAIACMLPHAGYIYSGEVAGMTVSRLKIKNTIILIGPNHTGRGAPFSIMTEGSWQTPLGDVTINTELATQILNKSHYLKDDPLAHIDEHSLEVELPFLQFCKEKFEIIPITILSENFKDLKNLGQEIGSIIKELKLADSTLIIASSDMTHYESQEQASKKDHEALTAIKALDENALFEKINQYDISMCGKAPVITTIVAAKILGAEHAQVTGYQTSAKASKDTSSVVGYAGVIIY
ncbi:MAG: AmmeMemoRadiSam system protein B [Candidatus Omnitrophota bacterium]|jgi:hypothetical protein